MKIAINEVGVGREVNPYNPYDMEWLPFELSTKELSAIGVNGNKLPVGEYEVDLVWQINHTKGWSTITKEEESIYVGTNAILRQVYIASVVHKQSLAELLGCNEDMPDIANHTYTKNPDVNDIEWAESKIKDIAPESKEVNEYKCNCKRAKCNSNYTQCLRCGGSITLSVKQPEKEVDTIEQEAEITPINLGVKNGIDPCPLCGGKEGETVLLGYKEPRYLITCTECNLTVIDDRKDKVQGKWNTRNGIDFWDKQSWLREVKSTHVPIEEVEKILSQHTMIPLTVLNQIRSLIKPQ